MRLPHLPDPVGDLTSEVKGAAHQFAHVAARVARHIDAAEHRANEHMHSTMVDAHKHGHKDPLRGPLGTAVRKIKP